MGSWGTGTFENDHVMDWLVEVERLAPTDDPSQYSVTH